jgi:hypothetical protein
MGVAGALTLEVMLATRHGLHASTMVVQHDGRNDPRLPAAR